MRTAHNLARTPTFVRRHRKGLTITGIIAAGLIVTTIGSYAVIRALPAEFPLAHSEQLPAGTTESVTLAAPETALTFARIDTDSGPTVLTVTSYKDSTITGVDISAATGTAFTEPIAAFNELGYATIEGLANNTALPTITVEASEALTVLDTHTAHIGTGTNYAEHQAEATIEEPFLFPKVNDLTGSTEPLRAGTHGLLDYEVELGIVALNDIEAKTGTPEHMGLVLSNDWSDRELLFSQIDADNLTSGAGFTNAKSQPGFLSTGDLFVIPSDWETYYKELQLDLYVNGDLRQRANPTDMIWDAPTMIEKILSIGDRTWDSDGEQVPLTPTPGVISQGTIIQSGTPAGVVHRAPDTRQRTLGVMEYAASFGHNAESVTHSALAVYTRDAHAAGVYLQPGDQVVTRAEGLGQIFTTIVSGERSETE